MVALVAHSVVGQDWLLSTHWSDAMTPVDSISATTTTISASTKAGDGKTLQVGGRAGDAPGDQPGAQ